MSEVKKQVTMLLKLNINCELNEVEAADSLKRLFLTEMALDHVDGCTVTFENIDLQSVTNHNKIINQFNTLKKYATDLELSLGRAAKVIIEHFPEDVKPNLKTMDVVMNLLHRLKKINEKNA